MIRRLGLGLTLFATGKMVFYDVSLLTAGSKIIAYFSFGLLLLGISYLYQKVSSRMEEIQAKVEGEDLSTTANTINPTNQSKRSNESEKSTLGTSEETDDEQH